MQYVFFIYRNASFIKKNVEQGKSVLIHWYFSIIKIEKAHVECLGVQH